MGTTTVAPHAGRPARRTAATLLAGAMVAGLALVAPLPGTPGAGAATGVDEVIGLTRTNALVRFAADAPGTVLTSTAVTGLQPGENLLGIDFRPATGELYGLGSTSRVYVVNPGTGVATAVAAPFAPVLAGTTFGFDFNPTVDRIRVVSDTGQNLRLNPNTGAVANTDAALNPGTPRAVAAAYANNTAGSATTTLFVIDAASDRLRIQNPPNNGVLTDVGSGLGVDAGDDVGFDIASSDGTAYASVTTPAGTASELRKVNLTTGASTAVGTIGGGQALRGLAVFTGATQLLTAVDASNNLLRFSADRPGEIMRTTAVTGLQGGEAVLGIDYRPATGQLYALGSTSRLYTLNEATGAATVVGTGPFTPALTGTSFGFDFNPVPDRIRVVSDTEQSLRLHPDTGAVAGTDANLTPAGDVVAAAYDRSTAGPVTATTLFGIDAGTDQLVRIGGVDGNPSPNLGAVTNIGALGVNAAVASASLDIAGSGVAYAALDVGGANALHTVNLSTGAATAVGVIGNGATALRGLATVPTGGVALSAATYATNEKAGTVRITVSRAAGTAGPVRVNLTTADGTARAPGDYAATSVTVTFGAGETSRFVDVPVVDDDVSDPDEAFAVGLFAPVSTVVLPPQSATVTIGTEADLGYWTVASDGGIFSFGDARFFGSTGAIRLNSPVVGMAATPSGNGYWLVAADGGIFTYGDAAFLGSTGAIRLTRPVVGMTATPSGKGYFLVASDGGIFAFGDATFRGSTGAMRLNSPVVGMASTPTGNGYWLVAADGGIFSFGDAAFFGSTGAIRLTRPVVGMATTPSGRGYWLVASDGGIFAFGDAAFFGSTGAIRLNSPVVGMSSTPAGKGYWMVAADGGIFSFGDATFLGSMGATRLTRPMVGMAPTP